MTKKYYHNFFLINSIFGEENMKKSEDKRMVKLEFLDIYQKIHHIHFLMHGHSLLIHIQFTPTEEGPHAL